MQHILYHILHLCIWQMLLSKRTRARNKLYTRKWNENWLWMQANSNSII